MMSRPNDLVVGRFSALFRGRTYPCRIGRSGFAGRKCEGDGATPTGSYALEEVFYRPDRIRPPRCRLPRQPMRRWHGWSDDSRDPDYNRLVRMPHGYRHEAMWLSRGMYDLLAVVDFNRDIPTSGSGSAIFLHVMDRLGRPTEGCIALRRPHLVWILQRWSKGSRIRIRPQSMERVDGWPR